MKVSTVAANSFIFSDFWKNMGPIIIGVVILLIIALIVIVRKQMKYRPTSTDVNVLSINEVTVSNPTMAMARNVPLSSASSRTEVTFGLSNGSGELKLRVPDHEASRLTKGMRGRLSYRGDEFLSFVANK